ncbi:MAG: acetoacetate--CoA ligase [Actinomycetota bacterium]
MTIAPLWSPSPERQAAANLHRLFRRAASEHGLHFDGDPAADYARLHAWSVAEPGAFWAMVWDELGIVGERGDRLTEEGERLREFRFLPDATLNVAENLLGEPSDELAMMYRGEDGESVDVTRAELHQLVGKIQVVLREAGVGVGDRIVAWLPNRPETYAVMLAAAGLGAVFASTSPDFGTDGVIDRFGQIEPTVLFSVPDYAYNGKRHDCAGRLDEIVAALPTLRRSIVVEPGWLDDVASASITFEPLPFDHPWYVLFSSGTTGKPKCIVHRAGGVLLKHLVEHVFHCDIRPGDRVFYFTTAGWMMWNWLASGLAAGATLILYDGAPTFPDANRLFDLADDVGVTFLGTSAKFLDACANAGIRPIDTHRLETVRSVASTGSTLSPEGFAFVYDALSADVHLASISGGTDLCGCLVLGNPMLAVRAGEIQVPALGLATGVAGPDGAEVGVGVEGELVCRTPFPSMPLRFWDDPGDERYDAAYFDRFPGLWHHGDFVSRTADGGFVISGRSDATLNPGGVRIGTAEIYRRVDTMHEVDESVVVGQPWQNDTRIVLFVKMAAGHELDDELRDRIRRKIRAEVTPRHVPAVIAAVVDIPRTRSGKITELAVRDTIVGRPIANVEALANPEALEHFRDHPELAGWEAEPPAGTAS